MANIDIRSYPQHRRRTRIDERKRIRYGYRPHLRCAYHLPYKNGIHHVIKPYNHHAKNRTENPKLEEALQLLEKMVQ